MNFWTKFRGISKKVAEKIEALEKGYGPIENLKEFAEELGLKPKYLNAAQYMLKTLGKEFIEKVDPRKLETARKLYGIGPKNALVLYAAGIKKLNDLTEELLQNYEQKIPQDLQDIIPKKLIAQLVTEAKFSLIPGLTGYHAHILYKNGIRSFKDLVRAKYEKLKSSLQVSKEDFEKWQYIASKYKNLPDPRKYCSELKLKEIEGIGDEFATFLKAEGITEIEDLLRHAAYQLINKLPDSIRYFFSRSEKPEGPLAWKVMAFKKMLEKTLKKLKSSTNLEISEKVAEKIRICEKLINIIDAAFDREIDKIAANMEYFLRYLDPSFDDYDSYISNIINQISKQEITDEIINLMMEYMPKQYKTDTVKNEIKTSLTIVINGLKNYPWVIHKFLSRAVANGFDLQELRNIVSVYIAQGIFPKPEITMNPPFVLWVLLVLLILSFTVITIFLLEELAILLELATIELAFFLLLRTVAARIAHFRIRVEVKDYRTGNQIENAIVKVRGEEGLAERNNDGSYIIPVYGIASSSIQNGLEGLTLTICASHKNENNMIDYFTDYINVSVTIPDATSSYIIHELDNDITTIDAGTIYLRSVDDFCEHLNINRDTIVQFRFFVEIEHLNRCGHAGLWVGIQTDEGLQSLLKYEIQDIEQPFEDLDRDMMFISRVKRSPSWKDGLSNDQRTQQDNQQAQRNRHENLEPPYTTLQMNIRWGELFERIIAPIEDIEDDINPHDLYYTVRERVFYDEYCYNFFSRNCATWAATWWNEINTQVQLRAATLEEILDFFNGTSDCIIVVDLISDLINLKYIQKPREEGKIWKLEEDMYIFDEEGNIYILKPRKKGDIWEPRVVIYLAKRDRGCIKEGYKEGDGENNPCIC